jgi:hypothetical protein
MRLRPPWFRFPGLVEERLERTVRVYPAFRRLTDRTDPSFQRISSAAQRLTADRVHREGKVGTGGESAPAKLVAPVARGLEAVAVAEALRS